MNCFDYLFEKTATLQKDLILGTGETISYFSVYEKSCQLADFINNKIGFGKNILLISQNSTFSIIAYLGILKSGNICIPLNPTIEQRNFDFIVSKTNSKIGIVSSPVLKKLEVPIEVISESTINSLTDSKKTEINFNFDGSQIAEIIFTSGSTSEPKGVMITHNNIIANTNSIVQYLNLNENDKILVVLPFFYCYGLSLLHTHIRVGGQIVIKNNFIFLASTIKNIKEYQCTGFAGVPSHFQILLRKTENFKNTVFPSLRYVTQAGGKLHDIYIKEFIESFPSIQFFVMYGQTEATARLSYLPPEKLNEKLGSIGKGIPGVVLKVVNQKGQNIMPGKIGEIIAKGENIMAGYYNASKENSKTLRNGWLYTGDLATIDHEGYIFIKARKTEIVKVGGKRVSLKEIEETIDMIPGVIDCSIESVEDIILGEAIKATIVVADHVNNLSEDIVKQFCSTKLASHKIPAIIKISKELKISITGKKTKQTH